MSEEQASLPEKSEIQVSREMLQEERYLWMARAFVVMLVLAVICDFVLLIALANVTPVMRVQPFYIETTNKDQQVISVSIPEDRKQILTSDALQESLVRQYLMAYFGVDADLKELEHRWGTDGPVFWMSSQSVYEDFKVEADEAERKARDENFTRDVDIIRVNRVPSRTSKYETWTADIVLRDGNRTSVKKEEHTFAAELRVEFHPARKGLKWEDRLKNPLGFTVTGFGLTQKSQK